MQARFLVLFVMTTALSGQGTIHFRNLGPGIDAPILNAKGELAGPLPEGYRAYTVELWAGRAPDALSPVMGTAAFTEPGYFGLPDSIRILDGIEPGAHPWFQVRCWRSMADIWLPHGIPPFLEIGESDVFQLAGPGLGASEEDASELLGLASFQLRLAVTLSVRMEGENIVVQWEAHPQLPIYLERAVSTGGPWQVVTGAVSPHVEPLASGSPVFFRIVALTN
jgi:hypothetical protein